MNTGTNTQPNPNPGPNAVADAVALRPGLCSVTLRTETIERVVELAAEAGLTGIEWGSDVHVTDAHSAQRAKDACAGAGLGVFSMGSYYRAGSFGDFDAVAELAGGIGAPRIRIWAGDIDAQDADAATWDTVVADTRRIASIAAGHSLGLAFEYHSGTLTGTDESTLELMARVDRPNVGTYWQPAVGATDAEALESLRRLQPHVVGIHCFSWWPATERLALGGRSALWESVVSQVRGYPCGPVAEMDAMLEFVAGDDPAQVLEDAATLRALLGEPAA